MESFVLPNERTEFLKARKNDLDLDSKIGKSYALPKEGATSSKGPFYCKVCEINFNDSLTYVDHLNGKRHNRILGMNMKVEAVSADLIQRKLEMLANKGPRKAEVVQTKLDEEKSDQLGKRSNLDEAKSEGLEEEQDGEEEELDELMEEMKAMGLPTKFK